MRKAKTTRAVNEGTSRKIDARTAPAAISKLRLGTNSTFSHYWRVLPGEPCNLPRDNPRPRPFQCSRRNYQTFFAIRGWAPTQCEPLPHSWKPQHYRAADC